MHLMTFSERRAYVRRMRANAYLVAAIMIAVLVSVLILR